MVKAIFIDIDGTLLNSKKEISNRSKKAINECCKRDIKVILTSGRSRLSVLEFMHKIKASLYIISSNGADAYDVANEKEIIKDIMNKNDVKKIYNFAKKNDMKLELNFRSSSARNKAYKMQDLLFKKSDKEISNIIKNEEIVQCIIMGKDIEKMQKYKTFVKEKLEDSKIENESKRLNDMSLKPSKKYYCDTVAKGVTKGKAVDAVCKYLKIDKSDIIAIGDGKNDVSMFRKAEDSVAMGNANEKVKDKAKHITDTNDNDGLAMYLEKILDETY